MESIRRLGRPSFVFDVFGRWRDRPAAAAPSVQAASAPAPASVLASSGGNDVPLYEAYPHLGGAPGGGGSDAPEPKPRKRRWKLWLFFGSALLAALLAPGPRSR